MMTAKATVLDAIEKLPDSASYEEIVRQIEFMAKVQNGMEQFRRGEGVSLEVVRQQVSSWASK